MTYMLKTYRDNSEANPDRHGSQEQLEKRRFEKILTIKYNIGKRSF